LANFTANHVPNRPAPTIKIETPLLPPPPVSPPLTDAIVVAFNAASEEKHTGQNPNIIICLAERCFLPRQTDEREKRKKIHLLFSNPKYKKSLSLSG
jgi:hypothetical protein